MTGNVGQADYAYANAFLDEFCDYRNRLEVSGQRHGKTIVINWPYWSEGGMTIDERKLGWLKENMGLEPMRAADGLAAFDRIAATQGGQWLRRFGGKDRFYAS